MNAAGVTQRALIHELTPDAWDRLVSVKLSSVFWTCRAVIGRMIASGTAGVIVNVGSIAGIRSMPGSPAYAATKGGVVALSRALALDHAGDGIRVHVITPPAVDTRLFRTMFESEPDPVSGQAVFENRQVGGRVLTVAEISSLIEYLIRREGPFYSPDPLVW